MDKDLTRLERIAKTAGTFESAPTEWASYAAVLFRCGKLKEAKEVYKGLYLGGCRDQYVVDFVKKHCDLPKSFSPRPDPLATAFRYYPRMMNLW